ncbi:Cell division protein FtsB [BD1-7 clade bacterium]|uniref:Cell division protein FtsB n=1 Tax=BD1-7 clade bacterium TaxID=2029982 RepID=A0A5S9PCZ2_9GAMM|nr:Cell division protein FtsB [BD1-7 clade bacterium]CAA0102329.1 Cell division protein FtsB [BD1-7 clade bacterium]
MPSVTHQKLNVRMLNGFLIVMFLFLQACLWVGEGSIGYNVGLLGKIEEQQRTNAQMKARNDQIAAEVLGLQEGHAGIEEYARSQLGMIKTGETFFMVVDTPTSR